LDNRNAIGRVKFPHNQMILPIFISFYLILTK
jgi:hypothetical protein